eukprot:1770154-Rhodomonas_salina.1
MRHTPCAIRHAPCAAQYRALSAPYAASALHTLCTIVLHTLCIYASSVPRDACHRPSTIR